MQNQFDRLSNQIQRALMPQLQHEQHLQGHLILYLNTIQLSDAYAAYFSETLSWRQVSVEIGARIEKIKGKKVNFATDSVSESEQKFTSPGLGIVYRLNDQITFLAGAYRGYSPAGPGSNVNPERSLNYEYGIRYRGDIMTFEAIGFLSDYQELIGLSLIHISEPTRPY